MKKEKCDSLRAIEKNTNMNVSIPNFNIIKQKLVIGEREMNVGIKDIEIVKNNILTSNDDKPETFLTLKFEFFKTNTSLTEIYDFIKEVQNLCDIKAPTV